MATMRLEDGLRIELVASEPLVQDPVAICWDAQGSLYVAEMGDYPQQPQGGRIRKLVDSDGDGKLDQFSLFVSHVAYPASVLPYRDGLLVAAAPNILWFRDRDGDGVAEHREILLTGFVEGNPQLRVNGLVWGLDSWVYGANGRSGGSVFFPQSDDRPGTTPLSINSRDFRFHPEHRRLETTGGFTQFGQSFDDFGRRFISYNTIHIRHVVMEQRYLERNPLAPITATAAEVSQEGSTPRIFPISQTTRRFNTEPPGYFNASCGLSIYRGHLLPTEYRGNAFACEPLSNLVHRDILEPNGTTFTARRPAHQADHEFLSASDTWFRPVNTTTGPDGALYVVDFYRPWVEHPQFVADPQLRSSVDFSVGGQFGRIYRIVPDSRPPSQTLPDNLLRLDDPSLIELLASPNAWQRETAQRLLIERRTGQLALLRQQASTNPSELCRLHAYGVLYGLNGGSASSSVDMVSTALGPTELARMLVDSSPAVRRMGLQWCESLQAEEVKPISEGQASTGPGATWVTSWVRRIAPLVEDADPQVRLQAIATLSYFPDPAGLSLLARAVQQDGSDPWVRQAIFAAISGQSVSFLSEVIDTGIDLQELDFEQLQWLLLIAASEATQQHQALEQLHCKLANDLSLDSDRRQLWQLFVSLAIARRLGAEWVQQRAESDEKFAEQLRHWSQWTVGDEPLPQRLLALAMTEYLQEPEMLELWRKCLSLEQPLMVQQWAARAAAAQTTIKPVVVASAADPSFVDATAVATQAENSRADLLVEALNTTSPMARRTVVDLLISRADLAGKLAEALQLGRLDASQLDALQRQLLLEQLPAARRQQLQQQLSATAESSRLEHLSDYLQAYDPDADRAIGQQLYQQHCQTCHAIGPTGNRVGPDLTAVAGRSPADIITDILDPNRSVAADGFAYAILTHDGEVLSGIIAGETAHSVTLNKAGGELVSVLRQEIQELRYLGKSLMPEGFEASLTPAQMSALVAYLKSPL